MMRKRLIILLWLLGILLPMAWFTRFSVMYSRLFQSVFSPLWMHIRTHAFLFAVLAYLLASFVTTRMSLVTRKRVTLVILALVLVTALTQEGFQLLYKSRSPDMDELFDLGVDLVGANVGVLVFWRRSTGGMP